MMKTLLTRLRNFQFPTWSVPLALLAACVLSYGILIPWLGFYWDDWAFVWISQKLGAPGLTRYFSTNRPVWGWLYQLTTPLLGEQPWHWQTFALVFRWLTGMGVWWLVNLLWPRRKDAALWASLLFVLYPGFTQQHIAITYGHFFVVLSALLISFCLTVLAVKNPQRAWLYTPLALVLAAANLFMMEYFFMLELLRPLVIWLALPVEKQKRLRCAALGWIPYLLVFVAAFVWRTFLFEYQNQNYENVLLAQLRAQPLQAIAGLALAVLRDFFTTALAAWGRVFWLPNTVELGRRTTQVLALLVAASLVGLLVYLLKTKPEDADDHKRRESLAMLALGLLAMLFAGAPFWMTNLTPSLIYPSNRFTLPFMLGSSLALAALLNWLPGPRWYKAGLVGVFAALAIGVHFQSANEFRRSWDVQRGLFWQLAWRMPALEPGTTLLTNDLPTEFCSDNSLTSPLNWLFAPENNSAQMSYMLYFPTVRLELGLKDLRPGLPIEQNYLASTFSGSTSDVVAVQYAPPACLRVLDPEIEPLNKMIPELMRVSAELTDTARITAVPADQAARPPAAIFGSEPAHNWCYYYQKADLARQLGDWPQVAALGDEAFALGDYPNDPMERLPFIEGYAHTGSWERALELSRESQAITPFMQEPLCRLWQRIDNQTPASPEKEAALPTALGELGCGASQ